MPNIDCPVASRTTAEAKIPPEFGSTPPSDIIRVAVESFVSALGIGSTTRMDEALELSVNVNRSLMATFGVQSVLKHSLRSAWAASLILSVAAAETDNSAKHWAYQPFTKPAPPPVKQTDWITTPIDAFILAPLEAAGIRPAPRADRRALIRRAAYDLIGLPPTEQEIQAFLDDRAPDAFDRLVDRLLASPQYGERWGRHWLDIARYADSNGLDENVAHGNAWRYRDYVVNAFNRDKPYDQFIVEQLAGDLLPPTENSPLRRERLIATGYLSLGPKVLAEVDKMKMEMDIIDEQIDTVGRSFMGLTLGCARCHDHKFDPIAIDDYYALAGIFKSTKTMESFVTIAKWQEHSIANAEQLAAKAAHDKKIADQKAAIQTCTTGANENLLAEVRARVKDYLLATAVLDPKADAETINAQAAEHKLNPDYLQQWHEYLIRTKEQPDSLFQTWHALREYIDALSALSPNLLALFGEWKSPTLSDLADRYQTLFAAGDHPTVKTILADAKGPFAIPKNVETHYAAATQKELTSLREALAELEKNAPALPTAMSVAEGEITDLPIHLRGNHLSLGKEPIPRRFPQFLTAAATNAEPPALDQKQSGRLQLANWLIADDHPLTARVMVNRIWRYHFGRGLVPTPDNFGQLGERPTNLPLLDWLAKHFIDTGWSVKDMHRLIMRSSVYQMAGTNDPDAHRLDPDNRLLWRRDPRRLEAEAIRDAILAVADLLDPAMGGPVLHVANREFIFNHTSEDHTNYDSTRRSLYLPVIRNNLYDVFSLFDYTDASVPNGNRPTTTVAPQALFLMNSNLVAQAAERLAATLLDDNDDDDNRLERLYLRAYARPPTSNEIARSHKFLDRFDQSLRTTEPDDKKRRIQVWSTLCQTILAANEFVYVQ
jgi:hypothetical protein